MGKISFENTYVDVPPGTPDFFKVEIVHAEATQTQRGSDRIRFKARVNDGLRTEEAHRYCTIREGFNLPNTGDHDMDEMMSRMWMSFFVSVGYSQDEVRSKGFDFDNVNKKGSFEYLIGRLGYDPAVVSAPFITTLVDASGLLVYFTCAGVIYQL